MFTSQQRDPESALDYFRARQYHPSLERFTSVDPNFASGALTDPQSWNGYACARNNPLKFTDPDGRAYKICNYPSGACGELVKDIEFAELQTYPDPGVSFEVLPSEDGFWHGCILVNNERRGYYDQVSIDGTLGPGIAVNGCDSTVRDNCARSFAIDSVSAFLAGTGAAVVRAATYQPFLDHGDAPRPCYIVFANEVVNGLNPYVPGFTLFADPLSYYYWASLERQAFDYAAHRVRKDGGVGLIKPLRSEAYRALRGRAARAAGPTAIFLPLTANLIIWPAVVTEFRSAFSADCR